MGSMHVQQIHKRNAPLKSSFPSSAMGARDFDGKA